jgi:dynein heavy chain
VKPKEFKATLFALCFFHSLISGRIKFGAQGWSKKYPFNDGDLTICGQVLCNYMNNAERLGTDVPWADLRYLFGDIMYGGHITDYWDRRVCQTYLKTLVIPELLQNLSLAAGFKSPDAAKMDYIHYQKFIDERFPAEQPQLFGLHPNAEIGFLTNQGIAIFKTVQSVSGAAGSTGDADISASSPIIARYLGDLPADLDLADVRSKLRDEDYTPYMINSLQESDRMCLLLGEIRSSLQELELAIGGSLNVTDAMEKLSGSLQLNRANASWQACAYPSLKSLTAWFADLLLRVEQLHKWTTERKLLKSIWLPGLFNPMAFLTAVMQTTAREKKLPLDFMSNRVVVTNSRDPLDVMAYPQNGVYVHGLFFEGASWEDGKGEEEGYIAESKMKELHPDCPIINVFSLHIEQVDWSNMYHCPVFVTSARGFTFVVEVNLRMDPDDIDIRWILAGAALLLADD